MYKVEDTEYRLSLHVANHGLSLRRLFGALVAAIASFSRPEIVCGGTDSEAFCIQAPGCFIFMRSVRVRVVFAEVNRVYFLLMVVFASET